MPPPQPAQALAGRRNETAITTAAHTRVGFRIVSSKLEVSVHHLPRPQKKSNGSLEELILIEAGGGEKKEIDFFGSRGELETPMVSLPVDSRGARISNGLGAALRSRTGGITTGSHVGDIARAP